MPRRVATPPPKPSHRKATRPALSPREENSNSSGEADCFTPRHKLRRSPPVRPSEKENAIAPSSAVAEGRTGKQEDITSLVEQLADLIDVAPPVKHWELPRTPPPPTAPPAPQLEAITEEPQSHKHTNTKPDLHNTQEQTPVMAKRNPLPLKAPPRPVFSPRLSSPAISHHPLHTTHSARTLLHPKPSPPIPAAANDAGSIALSGLVCTEEDLAFLERRKLIVKYEQLQSEKAHIDKALKSAAEHKEQLEHEAVKVNEDVERMKHKYRETVTAVHDIISSPSSQTSVVNHSALAAPSGPSNIAGDPPDTAELTEHSVKQLKKVHQLKSVQTEKVDKELKGRLREVRVEKERMEQLIASRELQLAQSNSTQKEWEAKVKQVSNECASMEERAAEVEQQLASQQQSDDGTEREQQKRRAEQKLRNLIRRCDLYVKKEKILRELGI